MSEVKKIPERSELCEADKWALEDLYPSDEAYEADLAKFKKLTAEMAGYNGKISQSAADLLAYLKLVEEAGVLVDNLANYAQRRSSLPRFSSGRE